MSDGAGDGRGNDPAISLKEAVASTTDRQAIITDLLAREYVLLKQEGWAHTGYYKAHVARFQLLVTGVLAFAAFVVVRPNLLPPANWWAWLAAATILPVVAGYLLFDLIEALYALVILGDRLSMIEERINTILHERVLLWETYVVPSFWTKFHPVAGVTNTQWFLTAFGAAIYVIVTVVIPCVLYYALLRGNTSPLRFSATLISIMLWFTSVCVTLWSWHHVQFRMGGRTRTFIKSLS